MLGLRGLLLASASLPTAQPLAAGWTRVASQATVAATCKRRRSVISCLASLPASPVSAYSTQSASSPSVSRVPFGTAFEMRTPRGVCLAVYLPTGSDEPAAATTQSASVDLHEAELEVMAGMLPHRRVTYAGGRLAMRRALRAVGAAASANEAVLTDDTGAPSVSGVASGSISHTDGLAAAFASAEAAEGVRTAFAVGVDVERTSRPLALTVARRVLTDGERRTLGKEAGLSSGADLLLRTSIKEALYKALHPLLRRTIRWQSVQVYPQSDGACAVCMQELLDEVGTPLIAEAAWCVRDGYFVSTAAASVVASPVSDM